jgi:uncharacterized protein
VSVASRLKKWYGDAAWTKGRLATFMVVSAIGSLVLGVILGYSYLTTSPPETSGLGWCAAWAALLSVVITLHVAAFLISSAIVFWLPRSFARVLVPTLLFTLVNIFLYCDTVMWGLNRLHMLDGTVTNVIGTPAAADSLQIDRATCVSAAIGIAVILVVECVVALLAALPALGRARKTPLITALLLVGLVATDKVMYAYGDFTNNSEIILAGDSFPFYLPLTVRRVASKLGYKPAKITEGVRLPTGKSALAYPKSFALPAEHKPWNVIIVAVEGGRFDMLDPQVMPNLHAWSRSHVVCTRHFSGGNATRFGLFSLLYGLNGTYWQQFLAERRGPFLIDALKDWGYQFSVLACTDLDYPEFRQTAFVDIPGSVRDDWPGQRVDRDRKMTDEVLRFMEQAQEPFFSFCFYDASHATYNYPPEHEVFTPVVSLDDIDYIRLSKIRDAEGMRPLFNRYRNSLHYVDEQIGRLLAAYERRGLLDHSLIFITGDHGEEFGELGLYGHNGSFDRYQVQSFMTASIPGHVGETITYMTSHGDVVPTILSQLGVAADPSLYCQGFSLLTEPSRPFVVSSSWDRAALIGADSTIVIGTQGYNPTFKLFDGDYRRVSDEKAEDEARRVALPPFIKAMREFKR